MKIIPLMACTLLLIILAGCTAPSGMEERTFSDDTGISMTVPDRVERVVSLAPSETELSCAAGGCDLLVGRTDYCNNPPGIERVETIGGPRTFSVEKVIELSPDLVLATTVSDPVRIQELRSAGLTVAVFRLETIDDIYRNIESLGLLLSVPDTAGELVERLEARQAEIEQRSQGVDRVKVLYILWDEPLYVAGNSTFQHDLITRAGGENIMADSDGYITISDETVVNRAPEVIIISREHTAGLTRIADRLLSRPSLADVPAVKDHRICEMEADLVNRPGPRVIEALEMFSRCISA